MNLKAAQQTLGAYFHQDWPEESGSADGAVMQMLRDSPPDLLRQAAAELTAIIDQVRKMPPGEALTALMEIGCYYDPTADGKSVADWLEETRNRIEATVGRA